MMEIQKRIIRAIADAKTSGISSEQLAQELGIELYEVDHHLETLSRLNLLKLYTSTTFDGTFRFAEQVTPRGLMFLNNKISANDMNEDGVKPQRITVTNSKYIQIGQDNFLSVSGAITEEDKTQIREVIEEVASLASRLELDRQTQEAIESDLATIQAQLKHPNTKRPILKAAFQGIVAGFKSVVEKVTVAGIAAELTPSIHSVIEKITAIVHALK